MSRIAFLTIFSLCSGLFTGCAMLDEECCECDDNVYEAEYRREQPPQPPHEERERRTDRPEQSRNGPGIYPDRN